MKQKFLLFLVVCVALAGSVIAQTTAYPHIVTYKWTGAAGGAAATEWANALNWDKVEAGGSTAVYDAYPNASTSSPRGVHNVWIPGGLLNYPVLSGNVRVDNLQLDAGGSINLGGFSLVVNGTVSGTGTFDATNVGPSYADIELNGKPSLSVFKDKTKHDATITAGTAVQNFTLAQQTLINGTPVNFYNFPASNGYGFVVSETNEAGTSASGTLAVIRNPLTSGATAEFKLATDNVQDALRLEFTGNPVYAFSAVFSCTDNFGPVTTPPGTDLQGKPTTLGTNTYDSDQSGTGDKSIATNEVILQIELLDGSIHRFTLDASGEYVGVNSNQAIVAAMVISGVKETTTNLPLGYATIHDFRIGTRGDAATLNFLQTGVANRLGSLTVNTAAASTGVGQVVLGNPVQVTEFVNPVSGTIVSGGNLVLASSGALGTARVSSHTTAGSISGNVTVERLLPGNRKKQWRFLAVPFSGSISASSLTGFTYSLDPASTVVTPTMMKFDESLNDGKYGNTGNKNAGYVSLTTSNQTINSGEGFAAWIYNAGTSITGTLTNSESEKLIAQGSLSETGADYSKALAFTAAILLSNNRGWNLVGNPFASTIDWGLVTKPGDLSGTIYKWDPQGEIWGIYNPATSSNTMNQYIESGASFFVKAGSASSLVFPQSAKTAIVASSLSPFSKSLVKSDLTQQSVGTTGTSGAKEAILKLTIQGPGNPEPAVAFLGYGFNDATSGFDDKYDAYFRGRSAGAAVSIQGENEVEHVVQYDRPIMENGKEKRIYPLIVTVPSSGKATINLEGSSNWNSLNRVYLIDKKEGKTIPVVGNSLTYEFNMATTKEADRFLLAINHVKMEENTGAKSIDVRVINNPIQQDVIDALITHPTAKPKAYSVVNGSGATLNRGAISNDNSIQHRLGFGKSNASGTFYLKVDFENGDSKTVKFIKL